MQDRRHLRSNTQEAHHSLRVPHRAQRALCAHLRQKHKVTERSASWRFEAKSSAKVATSTGRGEGGGREEREEEGETIISA
jgi:hypothetical protein